MDEARRHYEDLIAYAANSLDLAKRGEIERILVESAEARAIVERYRRVAVARREDDSVEPSQAAQTAAKAIFVRNFVAKAPISPPNWLEKLERLVASLIFDSRTQAAAVGLRGPSGTAVQLSFETSDAEVDLEIARDDAGRAFITGQVSMIVGELPASMRVGLARTGTDTLLAQTHTDAHGAFALTIDPGVYDLFIAHGDDAITLPNVEIN